MNITINQPKNLFLIKPLIEEVTFCFVCALVGLMGNFATYYVIVYHRSSPTDIYIFGLSSTSIFILFGFLPTHDSRSTFPEYDEKLIRRLFTRVFRAHVAWLLRAPHP